MDMLLRYSSHIPSPYSLAPTPESADKFLRNSMRNRKHGRPPRRGKRSSATNGSTKGCTRLHSEGAGSSTRCRRIRLRSGRWGCFMDTPCGGGEDSTYGASRAQVEALVDAAWRVGIFMVPSIMGMSGGRKGDRVVSWAAR